MAHRQQLLALLEPAAEESTPRRVNYSLRLGSREGDLHILYRGGCTELRTTDIRRAIRGLQRHLSWGGEAPPGAVFIDAPAVVRDEHVIILPRMAAEQVQRLDRRLRAEGVRAIDARLHALDLAAGTISVGPGLPIDEEAVHRLFAAAPRARSNEPPVEGTFPIAAWLFRPAGGDALSAGGAVRMAAASIVRPRLEARHVDQLVSLMPTIHSALFERDAGLVDVVRDIPPPAL